MRSHVSRYRHCSAASAERMWRKISVHLQRCCRAIPRESTAGGLSLGRSALTIPSAMLKPCWKRQYKTVCFCLSVCLLLSAYMLPAIVAVFFMTWSTKHLLRNVRINIYISGCSQWILAAEVFYQICLMVSFSFGNCSFLLRTSCR